MCQIYSRILIYFQVALSATTIITLRVFASIDRRNVVTLVSSTPTRSNHTLQSRGVAVGLGITALAKGREPLSRAFKLQNLGSL